MAGITPTPPSTGGGSGTVTGVTATSPLASSGGTAPTISINTSPNFTGFVGVNNASAGASLDVGAYVYNPGTVAVSGTAVTGTSTAFTKTFKVGDSITTTTSSGSETKEIQTLVSDTALTTVAAFAGTNSGATYTSSNTGTQFAILPNGGVRVMGTTGPSASNTWDWIYKSDTLNLTGTQAFSTFRDTTIYNNTTGAQGTLNSIIAVPKLNATGTGSFGTVRTFNGSPTVQATNTGNITSIIPFLSAPAVTAGATGTISNIFGISIQGTNSSSTNTVTNWYGVQVSPTQAAGTLTNYAGVAIAAKPAAATNSSLVLIGQTTIPSGTYGIYNSSTADNYIAGNVGIGSSPVAGRTFETSKNVTGATTAYGIRNSGIVQSDVTTEAIGIQSILGANGSFTLPDLEHFFAGQGTFTTASVTRQTGFYVSASLTGATNNYGFFGNIAAGTGRYNLYMNGTADNYLAGNLGIGSVPIAVGSSTYGLQVHGVTAGSSGASLSRWSADANGPNIVYSKSRGASIGTQSAVASGDIVGNFSYLASDGTVFRQAAGFRVEVDGTPSGDMPGRFVFLTTSVGSLSSTEKARITNSGALLINTTTDDGSSKLQVNGQAIFGGLNGAESLRVPVVASAVNRLEAYGATTTNPPSIRAAGSDTNISMFVHSKGTGVAGFVSNGVTAFQSIAATSAVNYVQANATATGVGVIVSAQGSDTNIALNLNAKGTGTVFQKTNAGSQISFAVSPSGTSDVNYVQATSSATGVATSLAASGTDSNIDLSVSGKGTGYLAIASQERSTSKAVVSTNSLTAATLTSQRTYFTGTAGASFAITFPAAAAAIDGALFTVMSTAARATTTYVSTGATFVGAPSSLIANTPVVFQYHHATTQWFITA